MSTYEDYAAGGQPLGSWLEDQFARNPRTLRIQSAYADATCVTWLTNAAKAVGAKIHLVLGSGGQSLPASVAVAAVDIVSLGGSFVIVDYSGALFHCKTYHFEFPDNSATAAVGSPNCTLNGLGYNDESYVCLSSTTTSEAASVAEVRTATDRWRAVSQPNVYQIGAYSDVVDAINARAIGIKSPVYTRSSGTGSPSARKARLWSPPVGAIQTGVAATSPGNTILPTGLATAMSAGNSSLNSWSKTLTATDAQQNAGSKTNLLRLTSGPSTATYFRDVLFKHLSWTSVVKTTGNARSAAYNAKVYEEATADFLITVSGVAYNLHTLKIDHALHRIAKQNNVPTVLHWGTTIASLLRGTDLTRRQITIDEMGAGLYSLTIA